MEAGSKKENSFYNALIRCTAAAALKETYADTGWSGSAIVLGKLPVPGRPTYLN